MTLFFPDVNVWVALSDGEHTHHRSAWDWWRALPASSRVVFARFTHLGLLRLLTNSVAMRDRPQTLRQAWSVYEQWLADPSIEFYPEPADIQSDFRQATIPWDDGPARKWVGDCYLLAFAKGCGATLVTFDRPLASFAKKHGFKAIVPA